MLMPPSTSHPYNVRDPQDAGLLSDQIMLGVDHTRYWRHLPAGKLDAPHDTKNLLSYYRYVLYILFVKNTRSREIFWTTRQLCASVRRVRACCVVLTHLRLMAVATFRTLACNAFLWRREPTVTHPTRRVKNSTVKDGTQGEGHQKSSCMETKSHQSTPLYT